MTILNIRLKESIVIVSSRGWREGRPSLHPLLDSEHSEKTTQWNRSKPQKYNSWRAGDSGWINVNLLISRERLSCFRQQLHEKKLWSINFVWLELTITDFFALAPSFSSFLSQKEVRKASHSHQLGAALWAFSNCRTPTMISDRCTHNFLGWCHMASVNSFHDTWYAYQ